MSLQLPVILYALVMMLMLCTALSFDYSLFTMTRYGEERRKGASLEKSIEPRPSSGPQLRAVDELKEWLNHIKSMKCG